MSPINMTSFTNMTSSGCPPPDATSRSALSILRHCGMTLLICVWQAVHPGVPDPESGWVEDLHEGALFILGAFFAPEAMVAIAAKQWWDARDKVIKFREKKYEWSMTHSYFAEMNGFVHCDIEGNRRTLDSIQFLEDCEAGKIANPAITMKEIRARSKSDALGKAIFALQLFWFTLHVYVRRSHGLAVTLVELDTLCMAVLTLLALFFWWDRPLRPKCPHIFYSPQQVGLHCQTVPVLSNAWKSEPSYLDTLMAPLVRTWQTHRKPTTGEEKTTLLATDDSTVHYVGGTPTAVFGKMDGHDVRHVAFCATWVVLGALHLAAWNFDFPTRTEKIIWRVASLVMTGGPSVAIVVVGLTCTLRCMGWHKRSAKEHMKVVLFYTFPLSVVSRALLVALMLSSLRALPCSAHQNVFWTVYIPHL